MADDQGKGAGKQALAPDVLAARAAEQRERDAAAFAEREYDLARQLAAANPDGNGFRLGRGFGRGLGQGFRAEFRARFRATMSAKIN